MKIRQKREVYRCIGLSISIIGNDQPRIVNWAVNGYVSLSAMIWLISRMTVIFLGSVLLGAKSNVLFDNLGYENLKCKSAITSPRRR
jgi:hypothetical protein